MTFAVFKNQDYSNLLTLILNGIHQTLYLRNIANNKNRPVFSLYRVSQEMNACFMKIAYITSRDNIQIIQSIILLILHEYFTSLLDQTCCEMSAFDFTKHVFLNTDKQNIQPFFLLVSFRRVWIMPYLGKSL